MPEKMWPGTISSSTISPRPSQKKMNARFGSSRLCRNPMKAPSGSSSIVAFAVCNVVGRPGAERDGLPVELREQIASVVGAMRSITSWASASSAVMLDGVGHEGLGDVLVATVGLGELADRGLASFCTFVGEIAARQADRGRGADVRAGRHRRDRSTTAGRTRPPRRRERRSAPRSRSPAPALLRMRLVDLVHRRTEAAGRVDRQEHGGGAVGVRAVDRGHDVIGDDRIDHAVQRPPGRRLVGPSAPSAGCAESDSPANSDSDDARAAHLRALPRICSPLFLAGSPGLVGRFSPMLRFRCEPTLLVLRWISGSTRRWRRGELHATIGPQVPASLPGLRVRITGRTRRAGT